MKNKKKKTPDPKALLRKCRHGCDDGLGTLNRKRKKQGLSALAPSICVHKAAKFELPTDGQGAHSRWQTPTDPKRIAEHAGDEAEVNMPAMQDLANKLLGFGLQEHEVGVVIAHDVAGMTFKEICEDGQFTSVSAVKRIYDKGVERAKMAYAALERGFNA